MLYGIVAKHAEPEDVFVRDDDDAPQGRPTPSAGVGNHHKQRRESRRGLHAQTGRWHSLSVYGEDGLIFDQPRLQYPEPLCIMDGMKLTKDLIAASAMPLILSLLEEGECYGYAIIRRVSELSGGGIAWTDGMLYPVLHRLEAAGADPVALGRVGDGAKAANIARCEPAVRRRWGAERTMVGGATDAGSIVGGATCLTSNDVSRTGGGALAETAGCTDEVLEELESHLRDEMQRLVQTGEPEERALDLALAQLGPPQVLGAEFAKLARDGAATWLPVRLANGVLLVLAAALVGYCASRLQDGGPEPPGQPRRRRDARLLHHAPGRRVGLLLRGDAILPPPRPAQLQALTPPCSS